jgi:hypothetical protein
MEGLSEEGAVLGKVVYAWAGSVNAKLAGGPDRRRHINKVSTHARMSSMISSEYQLWLAPNDFFAADVLNVNGLTYGSDLATISDADLERRRGGFLIFL